MYTNGPPHLLLVVVDDDDEGEGEALAPPRPRWSVRLFAPGFAILNVKQPILDAHAKRSRLIAL
jgi:hypothetical protein